MNRKPMSIAWGGLLIATAAAAALSARDSSEISDNGYAGTQPCELVIGRSIEYQAHGPVLTGAFSTSIPTISVARGERESVLAMYTANHHAGETPRLTIEESGPFRVDLFRLLPVHVADTSVVFDVMIPGDSAVSRIASIGNAAAFLIDIEVPLDLAPGLYNIRLSTQNCSASANVRVHDIVLPAPSMLTIQATIDPARPADGYSDRPARLAKDAMAFGVNSFAGVFPRLSASSVHSELGQHILQDFEKLLSDSRVSHFRLPLSQYHRNKTFFGGSGAQSSTGNFEQHLLNELAPYKRLLENADIRGKFIVKLWDEPVPANYSEIVRLHATVRNHLPGIPLELAEQPETALRGVADIWTIHLDYLRPDEIDVQHELGNSVFIYANSLHAVQNRTDSMRQIGWVLWRYNLDGYHFWRLNWWNKDPWTTPSSWRNDFDKTGTLFYPAPDGTAYSSIRMMAFRDGIDDWRLLRMLEQCTQNASIQAWLQKTRAMILPDEKAPVAGNVFSMREELLTLLESCGS